MTAYGLIAAAAAVAWPMLAEAASLRVAPVSLSLASPSRAGTITLRNDGDRTVNIQLRAFRWLQSGGADVLEPTREVVASPPVTALAPGAEHVVRIVRIARTPIAGEETYRLLIDELPDPERRRSGTVNVLLRYSVPVFFIGEGAAPPQVEWRLERTRDGLALTAANAGERHLRISDLRIDAPPGPAIALRGGLVGYVLGGSAMRWVFDDRLPKVTGPEVRLRGDTSDGGFDVGVAVGNRR